MSPLLSLLLTLHVGTLAAPFRAATVPFRAEAFRLAAEARLRDPPLLAATPGAGTLPSPTPVPPDLPPGAQLRPDEWVGAFADRLDLRRSGLVGAALWLVSIPVRLDVRPGHFSMGVTLHTR